jgi:hypothetical protein
VTTSSTSQVQDVAELDAGVEHRGEEGEPDVRGGVAWRRAGPSTRHACRATDRRRKRHEHEFGALADDAEDQVAVLLPEVRCWRGWLEDLASN